MKIMRAKPLAKAVPDVVLPPGCLKHPALSHEEIYSQYGRFAVHYVTARGTIVYQRSSLISDARFLRHVMVFEGEITEIGSDGKVYITKYKAGPDGFKVERDHIRKAPEVHVE